MWFENNSEIPDIVDSNIEWVCESTEGNIRIHECFWCLDWKEMFVFTKLIDNACDNSSKKEDKKPEEFISIEK